MLEVRDLSVELGEFALHGVSLHVTAGEYFCLLGPTGAGKTVLLECVCGLVTPPQGAIRVAGRDMAGRPPEVRCIGYVPQDYALFPHLSVADNIAYGLHERRLPRDEIRTRVEEMAGVLQITNLLSRRPTTLSGGERQRVALARALVLECRLLLLDEPFGAVDQLTKHELFPLLTATHADLGLTVVHVTHDFTEAHALADRVAVIDGGRLLQVGTVDEVFASPSSRTVAQFVGLRNIWATDDPTAERCALRRAIAAELGGGAAGAHWLCVPPGALRVSADGQLHADFTARGVVQRARWLGTVHELVIDTGAPLVVAVGAQEYARLRCAPGQPVLVGVDRGDIHRMQE